MARPVYRIVYKDNDTGTSAECGLLWPAKAPYTNLNLQAHTEAKSDKYGDTMPLARALELAADKKGWINVWSTEPRDDAEEDDTDAEDDDF